MEDLAMPELRRRYFDSRKSYAENFRETHVAGALDAKTKELMHLALVLANH
jgi:alkylhydroperoxidase/carboxymuconolactone decarboxylase family protein YurZ